MSVTHVVIDGIEYLPKSPISMMPRTFGEFMKECRTLLSLTLDQAADKSGVSKSFIWELEKGNAEPSLKIAACLGEAYGVSLETMASYLRGGK